MRFVACLALASSIAFAAPDAKLLDRGRRLEAAGKHAEAVAAFEAYVATAPDDPVGWGELGWAAFGAKDYDRAEVATRKAIATTVDPSSRNARAAAQFNLGTILEAAGKAGATTAYAESIQTRPTRAARDKLAALDPGMAARVDPLAPVALFGPFAAVPDPGPAHKYRRGRGPQWTTDSAARTPHPLAGKKLGKPFEDVVAFGAFIHDMDLHVAVKLHDGWYLHTMDREAQSINCNTVFKIASATVVTRAVPELRIAYTRTGGCSAHYREIGWDEAGVVVIGVGSKPSATSIATKLVTDETVWADTARDGGKSQVTEMDVKLEWPKDGSVEVSGHTWNDEAFLGKHLLAFP
jgi:hypothetical protein